MSFSNQHKVIIIGAGAAGVCLAWRLKELGIKSLILEKGKAPGNSWASMPKHLKIISPWKTNSLDFDSTKYSNSPNDRLDSDSFAKYLGEFSKINELEIQTNISVLSTDKTNKKFILTTNSGTLECDILINATGYFSNPWYPDFKKSIPADQYSMHFAQFKSVEVLKNNPKKVLVVGKRLSAGQLVEEFLAAGTNITLSTTGPVQFFPRPFLFNFFYRFIPLFDKLHMLLKGKKSRANIGMEGENARKAINDGTVRIRSEITGYESGQFVFKKGENEKFDLIIYATGFRPALDHLNPLSPFVVSSGLNDDFEHPEVKNLFFLGLDTQRDFTSRFLRGIRKDAQLLAQFIKDRL